jgi:hypothetical protein
LLAPGATCAALSQWCNSRAAELRQRSTIDAATSLRVAGIIERQVDGMTRLVDELLAFTKTKACALPPHSD